MRNALEKMTLEELWELFPIVLTEHNPCWGEWYLEEKARICTFLPMAQGVNIHHIGSTAISGIWAKPIIDILVEIPRSLSMEDMKHSLTSGGYTCMWEGPDRKSFNRGYTPDGFAEKVYHLHLRYEGDHDELYFRDLMNDDPELAKRYEALKLSLREKYEHDRDGYTAAKGSFIQEHTHAAKEKYKGRY